MNVNIYLARASIEEQPTLEEFLQAYLRELASFDPNIAHGSGRLEYHWLDEYWRDNDRFPYLIRLKNTPVGFVLVRARGQAEVGDWDWQIAEFSIAPEFRKRGFGERIIHQILKNRPGVWEISYHFANKPAQLFWQKIARNYDPSITPLPMDSNRERFLLNLSSA